MGVLRVPSPNLRKPSHHRGMDDTRSPFGWWELWSHWHRLGDNSANWTQEALGSMPLGPPLGPMQVPWARPLCRGPLALGLGSPWVHVSVFLHALCAVVMAPGEVVPFSPLSVCSSVSEGIAELGTEYHKVNLRIIGTSPYHPE